MHGDGGKNGAGSSSGSGEMMYDGEAGLGVRLNLPWPSSSLVCSSPSSHPLVSIHFGSGCIGRGQATSSLLVLETGPPTIGEKDDGTGSIPYVGCTRGCVIVAVHEWLVKGPYQSDANSVHGDL